MRYLAFAILLVVDSARWAEADSDLAKRFQPPIRCPSGDGLVEGQAAIYSGFYQGEFENSSFKMSHHPCEVWLAGDVCPIFGKGRCTKETTVKANITVEGVLSASGSFGHMGMWDRELRVTRVIKVERLERKRYGPR
jgi:hypothetical protein